MKIRNILFVIGVAFSQLLLAQQTLPRDPDCCTSIMVGKLASTDGSVMTSHTCDSWYRTWVNVVPAADFANDTVMNIYDGRMHTESVNDQTKLTVKRQIPQAKHTYAFLDTAYPCLNEKQLAMGETTISGRDTLRNPKGMFMIEELARHYGNDSRIIGWQLDNEPAVQFDYNQAAEEAFREFLKEKYHYNIQELNAAWGTAFWSEVYSRFEEITLPKTAQMFMNHHQILDYRRFAAKQTNDFLNEQCRLIKKYAKNQWVTTNYIPDYDKGHIGGSKDLDFVSYTRYMVYGDNEGIGRRGYRVGNPLRIAMANDFFRPVNGTYGVMELQPGQVNWGSINPQPLPGAVRLWLWSVFAGGSDFICTYRYRQPLYGTEQYHYGIVGTDGVTVTPGGREYEQFMKEIRLLRKDYCPKEDKPETYLKRKTAILWNPENYWSIDRQKQNATWNTFAHVDKYYRTLKSYAAPVDFISEEKDFSQYPVMIVPAYQLADKKLVARWKKYVEEGGNLVLTCRTAQKDRFGRLPEAPFGSMIDELTGNHIEFYDLLLSQDPGQVKMDGKVYTWNTWGEILQPGTSNEVWATYTNEFYEGKPAVTFRKLGKGSVTYIGVDSSDGALERQVLDKLYSRLQIEVMNLPYGVTMEYRNGLGIVLNYSDQPYQFALPQGAKVLIGTPNIATAGVLVFKF